MRALGVFASAAVALAALATTGSAATLQLVAVEDALVISDPTRLDENFGADPQIVVWANYPNYGARSYLKFDLSSVPSGHVITGAVLELFQFNGGGFASGVDVFRVASDSGGEGTITWNNQPVLDPALADRIAQNPTLTGYERGWVTFDLLANGVWAPSVDLASGDGQLSLILRITGGELNTQRAHNLCSSEAGGFDCLLTGETGPILGRAPRLVLTTTAVPEPRVLGMLTLGLAMAFAGRPRTRRP
jgi:hypothetical protein